MDIQIKKQLFDFLCNYITANKLEKIERVAANRTKYLTIVLEDLYQSQNASATLRTSEGFGLQEVYVIENRNKFEINKVVTQGASKWLDIYRYNKKNHDNTTDCIRALKEKGYRIVATTLAEKSRPLLELPIDSKTALLFGAEDEGLTETALSLADEWVTIPMFGFSQSFNISVSVAICLFHLTTKLRNSEIEWRLSEEELLDVKIKWAKKIIPRADVLERNFLKGMRANTT